MVMVSCLEGIIDFVIEDIITTIDVVVRIIEVFIILQRDPSLLIDSLMDYCYLMGHIN